MILHNYRKNKGGGLWNGIKKLIDDIISDIEEIFGQKLKPIKIKNNKKKH